MYLRENNAIRDLIEVAESGDPQVLCAIISMVQESFSAEDQRYFWDEISGVNGYSLTLELSLACLRVVQRDPMGVGSLTAVQLAWQLVGSDPDPNHDYSSVVSLAGEIMDATDVDRPVKCLLEQIINNEQAEG